MSASETNRFVAWARRVSSGQDLICHFYVIESTKQYYDNADFAYFNLRSSTSDWIVKGTTGHGIRSKRGKSSQIPCLNCFAVNQEFYDALRVLSREENKRFKLGLVLDKRMLANQFTVVDVSTEYPHPRPPPNQCHHYDIPYKRQGTLSPFNYCDVVRIEIPRSEIGREPIVEIPPEAIMAVLTKPEDGIWVNNQLESKEMNEARLFCPL